MFEIEKVYQAQEALKNVLYPTPLLKFENLLPSGTCYLKCENLQHTGSFKIRGAYFRISQLSKKEQKRGVIAASAGNHAQGVALAAQLKNIKATIVMPKGAPILKAEATRRYGAEVILAGDSFDEAYQHAKEIQKQTGAIFIEPFNDESIIAGQGTLALEILSQKPDLEVLLLPVGGGGLAAGIASVIKNLKPQVTIYGVEAADCASMALSFEKNQPTTLSSAHTIADGIFVKRPGDLTFSLCHKYLDAILTVSEEEIASGILTLMEKTKLVVEGAGAVAFTAALYEKADLKDKKTVCLLSGGNIDVNMLARIIDRGLAKTGRKLTFGTILPDKPGMLYGLLQLLANHNANIISIQHDRSHPLSTPDRCFVEISIETANVNHRQSIIDLLANQGYKIVLLEEQEVLPE
ncbi:MAG: threonine ammonia-lyase [Erysipelotrichaceae bacterium]|nr:threonine ammonia-lyase [Erysipelotrichaceae bacterium]